MVFNMRGTGSYMHQVGFMCNGKLVIDIDDELLLLDYDSVTNKIINVSRLYDDITDECKEIDIDVEERYTTKYYPRIYYIIYELRFNGNIGYLLERYDGTSASSEFYLCDDYKSCRDHI